MKHESLAEKIQNRYWVYTLSQLSPGLGVSHSIEPVVGMRHDAIPLPRFVYIIVASNHAIGTFRHFGYLKHTFTAHFLDLCQSLVHCLVGVPKKPRQILFLSCHSLRDSTWIIQHVLFVIGDPNFVFQSDYHSNDTEHFIMAFYRHALTISQWTSNLHCVQYWLKFSSFHFVKSFLSVTAES